jgi:ABC-type transport system involved in multi-copper enzyme maturation permease subunit
LGKTAPPGWRAAFRFELRKALRSRATWMTLGMPALLAALSVWFSHAAQSAELAQREAEGISSAFLPFARGASSGLVLAGVLLLFQSSMLLANEGTLRTYKTILVRPHTRAAWVFAKLAVALLLGLALLAAVALAALIAGSLAGDYTAIAEEGYVIYAADRMQRESLLAVLLVVPPLISLAAFGLMVSALTDHSGIAASVCIGGYVMLDVLKGSLGGARVWLFNAFMPSLLDTSYLESLRGLANGMSDTVWDPSLYWFNVATPLLWALLFVGVAWVRFARRDFAL